MDLPESREPERRFRTANFHKTECIIATALGKVHTIFLDESTKILDFLQSVPMRNTLVFEEDSLPICGTFYEIPGAYSFSEK